MRQLFPFGGSVSGVSSSLIPNSSADRERATLIGLTSLRTNGQPVMEPRLNRRRALFVLGKIDEILSWERSVEQEKESRFVDLGRYLRGEVRSGQYWRVDNLKSFDEFLEKKFPESRRKAYYLMAIHEHGLPRQIRSMNFDKVGWTKASRTQPKVALCRDGHWSSIVHPGCTKPRNYRRKSLSAK